jgi:hypothetical protein
VRDPAMIRSISLSLAAFATTLLILASQGGVTG